MTSELTGRFTGMRPERLDKVVQQFLSDQAEIPRASRTEIQDWITKGAVEIDGHMQRRPEAEVRPGSFLKVKIPAA